MRAAPRVASGSPSDSAPAGAHVSDAAGPKAINARLVRSVDFERVLRARPCALSAHFAVHHVARAPRMPRIGRRPRPAGPSYQQRVRTEMVRSVDDLAPTVDLTLEAGLRSAPGAWLGCVVPKRHARRAVTRTLLKRQIRSAAAASRAGARTLGVRLRAGFDRAAFPSAASEALARAARGELDALLAQGAASRIQRPGLTHACATRLDRSAARISGGCSSAATGCC